jgi:molecular chaperone DnaK (HSP70)
MVADNHLLGSFNLTNLKPAPRSVPQIEVTFEIDANGMLFVSAEDRASNARESIVINAQEARLSEAQREAAIRKAEEMRDEDSAARLAALARTRLQGFLVDVMRQVDAVNATLRGTENATANEIVTPTPLPRRLARLGQEDLERLREIAEEGFGWIDEHPHDDRDSYEDKLCQVQLAALPILGEDSSPPGEELGGLAAPRSYIDDL